jgi:hypothetical protein
MTPEQQRIAIAKKCPFVEWNGDAPFWLDARGSIIRFDPLNDLNAMHEAEEIINQRDLRVEYMEALDDLACQWGLCHATAAQRAEAFVLTLEPE